MDSHPIEQHIPRLRRYARALVRDRYAADDLVQDTLERAWNKLHLWRQGSDMRAWLFTIMHNVFVNQARSRRQDMERGMEEMPVIAVRGHQGQELELLDMDRALQMLPSEQREVLLLVAIEELSYGETSKALGVPIGTVMSRLSRARERLRLLTNPQGMTSLKVVK